MAFTNPFRYFPSPEVVRAAKEVMDYIGSSPELHAAFSEGKMIGILIVELPSEGQDCAEMPFSLAEYGSLPPHVIPSPLHVIPGLTRNLAANNNLGYLAAFSGSVGGRSHIDGFVPPIFDLLDPSGHFKIREAEITDINRLIDSLSASPALVSSRQELSDAESKRDEEISTMRARMAISKRERDKIRSELSDSSGMPELIRQSQFEKAELKRLKNFWEDRISALKEKIAGIEKQIKSLKTMRAEMSDRLQEWIFRQYIVHNALGEESSVWDIFAAEGLVPPGGTGDCAAPKLLEYAFRHGLRPVAMGEFWYGKSPETAVRTHGHFYPSCTSKCGPLLGWMLSCDNIHSKGYLTSQSSSSKFPDIIYEDEAIVTVEKPSGMPSVPGLDGRVSVLEILGRDYGELHVVHRLDMDTSGVLLFAKTPGAAVELQKQFENHTIRKTYMARLSPAEGLDFESDLGLDSGLDAAPEAVEGSVAGRKSRLKVGDKGRIELPLSPDYDERPRQKVDMVQGKTAVTDYEVVGPGEDGCLEVIFHPLTGRTHQLRVHAAHTLGLGRPILGDPLYGGSPAPRLALHAASITFRHPISSRKVCIKSTTCAHFPHSTIIKSAYSIL